MNNDRDETTIIELVNSFNKLKGIKLYIEMVKWVFTGIFMGTSDAIPGYSGGTSLALLGFFKRLILIAKSIFVPEPGLTRIKAMMFMIPFGIGWMAGVFGFAKVTALMAEKGMGLELMFFFAAFIIFAIPVFLKSEDPQLRKSIPGFRWRVLLTLIGFSIVLGLSIYVFITDSGPEFVHTKAASKNLYDLHDWWKLMLVAYFGGMITLIPGGSGAIVQLLSGQYANIHWVIMAQPINNFGALAIFSAFNFLGMLTTTFIFAWLFKKHEKAAAAFSFGMLIASVAAILMVPNKDIWEKLNEWEHIVGIIGFTILGGGFGFAIKKVINYKINIRIQKKTK